MAFVVIPILLALCLTPTRIKRRLVLCVLALLSLCSLLLLLVFPLLGWTGDPFVSLRLALVSGIFADAGFLLLPMGIAIFSAFGVMVAALIGVLANRRPRYLLPFIPVFSFALLYLLEGPQYGMGSVLSISVFVLCLPFLILIPFMQEYSETKDGLRQRYLVLRAGIADNERERRSEEACALLLEKLRELSPDAGYIGLYSAQGSELPLGPLAVRLGALGYRTAYPVMLPDSQMGFFTTLGVSDEVLFASLLEDRPFDPVIGANPERLTTVEASELSALIVSGIAFDKDRYRLGRGAGRYDRYIAGLEKDTLVLGIGFSEQMVEAVPVEPHDQPLSGVIVA
jgi:5-formyltetrahydrofolate cyclo-ligase